MRWMTDAQTAAVSRSSGNTRLRAQPDGDGGAGDGSEAAAEDRGATSIDAQKMDEIEKRVDAVSRRELDAMREAAEANVSATEKMMLEELQSLEAELKNRVEAEVAAESESLRNEMMAEIAPGDTGSASFERNASASTSASSSRSPAEGKNTSVRPTKDLIVSVIVKYWALKTVLSPATLQLAFALFGADAGTSQSMLTTPGMASAMIATQLAQNLAVLSLYADATKESRLSQWPRYRLDLKNGDDAWRSWAIPGALGAAAALLVSYGVQSGVDSLIGSNETSNYFLSSLVDSSSSSGSGATFFEFTALLGVLVPVAEEMIFRGFIQPSLATYVPTRQAILLTSVAFALFHSPWTTQPTMLGLGYVNSALEIVCLFVCVCLCVSASDSPSFLLEASSCSHVRLPFRLPLRNVLTNACLSVCTCACVSACRIVFGTVLSASNGNLYSCTLSHVLYNLSVISLYAVGVLR